MFPDIDHMDLGPKIGYMLLTAVVTFLIAMVLSLRGIPPLSFVILLIGTTIGVIAGHPEQLPACVFWVSALVLLPFIFIYLNLSNILLWGLIIGNRGHISDALPIIFLVVFIGILPAIFVVAKLFSIPAFLVWVVACFIMLDKLHFLMHPGYWISWIVFMIGLSLTFSDEAPWIWSVVESILIALMGFIIYFDHSVVRFVIFTLTTAIPMPIIRPLFNFVYVYPETYLFAFNLVSPQYKVSSSVWLPIDQLESPPNVLCGQCAHFTSQSKLIMGAFRPLVSLTEWHNVSLRKHLSSGTLPCDLCPLLWGSVPSDSVDDEDDGTWKIKIWQTRPLSRYVFAKLYHGDKPVGLRLLIHRGKNFNNLAESSEQLSTNSTNHISLARHWLTKCKKSHEDCRGIGDSSRSIPTRLLYVEKPEEKNGPEANPKVRLVLTDPDNQSLEYLALSHCWGGASTLQLLESNLVACQENIDFSVLSKNVQDSIRTTLELDYSYIWVDSLCIIQDANNSDWDVEAKKMRDVYANAACTLASTSSTSGDGGCFHMRENDRCLKPCRIGVSHMSDEQEWIYVRRDDLSDFRRGVDYAPLNKRGWVLQERLLSHRILHFGADMIYWECCLRAASELCPEGFVYKEYPAEYYGDFLPPPIQVEPDGSDLKPSIRWHRSRMIQRRLAPRDLELGDVAVVSHGIRRGNLEFMREIRRHAYEEWSEDRSDRRYRTALEQILHDELESTGILSFSQCWYSIVEAYTRSRLTFSSDMFVAIGGMVEKIQESKKYHFVAGLWEEYMVECLLWFVVTQSPSHRRQETKKGPTPQEPLRGSQMAPSWSWVSVDAAVTIDQLPVNANRKVYTTRLTKTCTATVQSVPKGPSGEDWKAVEGTLEVEAPLAKVTRLELVDDKWVVHVAFSSLGPGLRSVQLVPDLAISGDSLQGDTKLEEVFCLSLLALQRDTEKVFHIGTSEVQGIVVRHLQSREGKPDIYERIGFFTTGRISGSSWRLRHLKNAPAVKIHVV